VCVGESVWGGGAGGCVGVWVFVRHEEEEDDCECEADVFEGVRESQHPRPHRTVEEIHKGRLRERPQSERRRGREGEKR
jgi:hypothetical protein